MLNACYLKEIGLNVKVNVISSKIESKVVFYNVLPYKILNY
jgi:hypothetical protein